MFLSHKYPQGFVKVWYTVNKKIVINKTGTAIRSQSRENFCDARNTLYM